MFMIKSNGGNGTLSNCQFNNFMGHDNAYTLDINAYWPEEALAAGNGVQYTDLSFDSWHGTCSDGLTRAPINIACPSEVVCKEITIENFYVWTETGDEEYYKCANAYGTGPCLQTGTAYTTYTSTGTVTTMRQVAPSFDLM